MRIPSRKNIKTERIAMGRHIVYSEGTKTEPFYVQNISEHLPIDLNHRNILIPKKYKDTKHTIDLLKRAENDINKERKAGKTVDGVWILFDKDSFDDFDEACKLIEGKNTKRNMDGYYGDEHGTVWHCCYSNESFEIWPYLHFEDLSSALHRDSYIGKINSFIKNRGYNEKYKKNEKKLYDFLERNGGDVNKAIRFAKRKDDDPHCSKTNPSTRIYDLVEFFKAYFKQ